MYLEPHERFKSARTDYNVNGSQTMAQVANATGVPQSVISDLERDPNKDADHPTAPRKVAYQTVAALAKHYGVSANFLLGLPEKKDSDIRIIAADRLGLSSKAIKHLEDVKRLADDEQDPEGDFHRRLAALNSILRSRDFSKFLTYFTTAEKAAAETRSANQPFEEVKDTHRLPQGPVSLTNRESYSYHKYLCLRKFEKMLDAFCKAEDLDD